MKPAFLHKIKQCIQAVENIVLFHTGMRKFMNMLQEKSFSQ